jgi:hypothetical protein
LEAGDILALAAVKEPYRTLIYWFLDLAADVVIETVNQMTPKSVAIVFAPNLLSIHTLDPQTAFAETQRAVDVVQALVLTKMTTTTTTPCSSSSRK